METTETIEMKQPEFEIKGGYKKTNIGCIPEDWDVFQLESIVLDGTQNGIYKSDSDNGLMCELVNMKEIFRDNVITNEIPMRIIRLNDSEKKRFLLFEGDLLLSLIHI